VGDREVEKVGDQPDSQRLYDRYTNPWARRRLRGWRIYSGGKSPDGRMNMKVLWSAPAPTDAAPSLIIRGTSTSDGTRFVQVLAVGPSIVKIPRAGCWHLSLKAGAAKAQLTVLAVAPR
jgi:hypothetical protein